MQPPNATKALLAAAVLCSSLGCSARGPVKKRHTESPAPDVLVTVNGHPITEEDLALKTRPSRHEAGEDGDEPGDDPTARLTAAQKKAQLETIVQQELEAQRAHELGLDQDPTYRQELSRLQASVDAFRRQRLVELYARHEREATKVTDADARRYFQENKEHLQTELHVLQILMRDERKIDEAHRAVQAGTFEQVAAGMFPALPEGTRPPWDLGYLRYNQLPEPWRGVVDRLEDGGTSGIIRGPRNRFWIVKVVERRRDPNIQFETWRANITEMLREERLVARRAETERSLRQKAKIRYIRDPRP